MAEYAYEGQKDATREGAIQELDAEIERLGKAIDHLSATIAPVTAAYAKENVATLEPRAEPATRLRAQIEQIRNLTGMIEHLIRSVDL